jgi:hypothetical protein
MTNEELYEKALEAIRDMFGDTSVGASKTRENLEGLIDEIEMMLDTLDYVEDE